MTTEHRGDVDRMHLLLSFAYTSPKILDVLAAHVAEGHGVFIDSGAFTAWKAGNVFTVQQYAAFLRALPFTYDHAFTLDVIGDEHGTLRNFAALRDAGVDVTPIFTRGSSLSALEAAFEASDLVGVGGLVGTPNNTGYVKWLMTHVGARKVHWLGFVRVPFIARYRPFSVDSSTWGSSTRVGNLAIYFGAGRMAQFAREVFHKRPPQDVVNALASYDIDARDLASEAAWRESGIVRLLGARSYVRFSRDVARRYGTRIGLAGSTVGQFKLLTDAVHAESHRTLHLSPLRRPS